MKPIPDSERTIVVRPRPGARGAGYARADPADADHEDPFLSVAEDAAPNHPNPLLALAQPLLALVSSIRGSTSHPDPAGLRERLLQQVAAFERGAQTRDIAREQVIGAKYVLCSSLDEAAAGTPWGGGSWGSDTLLMRLFNESWGGEKVFQLLSKLAERPDRNRDLIELIYVCLCLGFEGRYRIAQDGSSQLEALRGRLHQLLRNEVGAADAALSARWQPAAVLARSWASYVPLWVVCAGVAVVTLAAYLAYGYALASRSDPVFASIQQVRLASATPPAPIAPAPAPRLATLLAPEASARLLSVVDQAHRSVVVLGGDQFFDAASASVPARGQVALDRVGQALARIPGKVVVSGHTDAQPIRTARFPSNWHLSRARAETVMQHLARFVPAERIRAEGRADAEPVAPNDTAAGRAQNRRVEIVLLVER